MLIVYSQKGNNQQHSRLESHDKERTASRDDFLHLKIHFDISVFINSSEGSRTKNSTFRINEIFQIIDMSSIIFRWPSSIKVSFYPLSSQRTRAARDIWSDLWSIEEYHYNQHDILINCSWQLPRETLLLSISAILA